MRRIIFLLTGALVASTISTTERKQLLDHLAQSQQAFEQALRGVTPAQAKFKAAPDKWSVMDCAEHLTKAESFLFGRVQDGLKAAVEAKSRATDDDVLDGWGTRKQKVKAPPVITPTGEWADLAAIQKEFTARRARTIQFVETTKADLRGQTCCGGMDLYQQLLGLSAHTLRHVDQMREVKADPNYPKF
jgi:hypothetical protein